MAFVSAPRIRTLLLAGLALGVGTAQAHTGHGTSGLWTGMAHPLGLDHLLAMVAVGVWSVSVLPRQRAWWGPAAFLLALVLGAGLGASGLLLPGLEHGIALSVVLFGAMLVLARQPMPLGVGLGLVAAAAVLHGMAHGAEAPASGFGAYALGFMLTTAALHFGGMALGLALRYQAARYQHWALAGLGSLCSTAGLYLFSHV